MSYFLNIFNSLTSLINFNSLQFKYGLISGITLTSLFSLLITLKSYWNYKLSFLLNIVNIIDIKSGLLLSKLCYYNENDIYSINLSRKHQNLLPLGPIRNVKEIIKTNIISNKGHHIPIQVFIPLNHIKNSPIIIFFHGGIVLIFIFIYFYSSYFLF